MVNVMYRLCMEKQNSNPDNFGVRFPILLCPDHNSESIFHEIHLIEAGMNAKNSDNETCKYRAKLLASFVKLFLIRPHDTNVVNVARVLIVEKANALHEKILTDHPQTDICLPVVQKPITSNAFRDVPDMINMYAVALLNGQNI